MPPALLQHTQTVFRAMRERANEYDDGSHIYTGYLTKLFIECGLSIPQYTPVMQELQRMDCVLQLRRGGGTTESQWQLLQEPTEEMFTANHTRKVKYGRNRRPSYEMLEQRVNDLNKRLQTVEASVGIYDPELLGDSNNGNA